MVLLNADRLLLHDDGTDLDDDRLLLNYLVVNDRFSVFELAVLRVLLADATDDRRNCDRRYRCGGFDLFRVYFQFLGFLLLFFGRCIVV